MLSTFLLICRWGRRGSHRHVDSGSVVAVRLEPLHEEQQAVLIISTATVQVQGLVPVAELLDERRRDASRDPAVNAEVDRKAVGHLPRRANTLTAIHGCRPRGIIRGLVRWLLRVDGQQLHFSVRRGTAFMSETMASARRFAVAAHRGQRYRDYPYVVHLDAVAGLLAPFGQDAQVVGFLHDVVEDTDVTLDEVRARFGERVAACVAIVTDEPGATRRARKAKTHAKLSAVAGENSLALIVKAADRLANLRASTGGESDSKLDMYRREHPAFRAAAYRPGLCDGLWHEMDRILGCGPDAEHTVGLPRVTRPGSM